MKKVLALVMTLVVMLSLAACGWNSVEEKKNITSAEATEEEIFVGPPKPDTTKIFSEQS